MTPSTTTASIKAVLPEDSQRVAVFIRQHSGGLQQSSAVFIMHHCSSIWMAVQTDSQQIIGVIISWLSPSLHSAATVESIVLHPDAHRKTIASALLDTAVTYWQNACLKQLTAPAYPHNHWLADIFIQAGFTNRLSTAIPTISKQLQPLKICLHNKRMRPRINSANGQVDESTLFHYYQEGDYVWGTYSGGSVERGVLIGKMNAKRNILFHYLQIEKDGTLGQGFSNSSTEYLNNGRLALYEDWEWTGNRSGSGTAIIEEVEE